MQFHNRSPPLTSGHHFVAAPELTFAMIWVLRQELDGYDPYESDRVGWRHR